ncbi:hypothetical protein [Tenacibaculum larymnensis]|uniref:Uncharacterized protein n=1 Tax=Tenacibaculum larymnensis TaxID=2878201 RepID=A0A9X4EQQ4_9FLAO|nr:hypothetical protein [Tenacibaculum larymnensis]MDE1207663.1 hypothetical protein [Tenacibaculum larymnensis]
MKIENLVKLTEEIPNFPTLSLVEGYKHNSSPKARKEMEDMLREMANLLPVENTQDVTSCHAIFKATEPTALYYNHDVVFDRLNLDAISENALVINGDLKVNTLLLNAEIDVNTSLVVLGNVYAKNFICSGSEIYVAKNIYVANNFIAYYNHGSIKAKSLHTNVLLTDDYWGFQISNYQAKKNCHWQDEKALPYKSVIKPVLVESIIGDDGKQQQWLNFEKICDYIEADKSIVK